MECVSEQESSTYGVRVGIARKSSRRSVLSRDGVVAFHSGEIEIKAGRSVDCTYGAGLGVLAVLISGAISAAVSQPCVFHINPRQARVFRCRETGDVYFQLLNGTRIAIRPKNKEAINEFVDAVEAAVGHPLEVVALFEKAKKMFMVFLIIVALALIASVVMLHFLEMRTPR